MCLTPSSSLLPLFPSVTTILQLCPAGSIHPHPCANPTAAPLAPFRVKFSLNQGSSGDGGGLPRSNVKQRQNRGAPRLPEPHSCMTGWVFCLCIIGLEAKEENYYSVVSQCSCWPLLVHLWFVFVFACSLTSVSGFTARAVSCRHLPV